MAPILVVDIATLPFVPIRIYVNSPDKPFIPIHRHQVEQEVFYLISGSATILIDDGRGLKWHNMEPHKQYYVPAGVWHGFSNISPGTSILAVSSTSYDPTRSDHHTDYTPTWS
jgi:oxalate decarboxylase/phosphoglucose isomerase-like protein (cupin superfamily)